MNWFKAQYKLLVEGENPRLVLVAFPFLFFIILFLLPYLLTGPGLERFDYTETGQIGDTIGGIAGPVIAIIAAFLTFFAFWVQLKANIKQTTQFDKQDTDTKIDRFENKFYELLRLHKENVDEISIDGYNERKIERRKSFVSMYRELRYTFFVVKKIYNGLHDAKQLKAEYSDELLLRLAYIFFYAGVGIHSDKLTVAMAGNSFENLLFERVNTELKNVQNEIVNVRLHQQADIMYPKLEIPEIGIAVLPKSYAPFVGHLNRFGHYYRHLFQTVKFVVSQKKDLIEDKQKLEYLRTLRAQLSDHEQVMLYYNAVAGFGQAWLDNKYFTDFKMIHNLPLPLADFGVIPEKKFEKEIDAGLDLFEWL